MALVAQGYELAVTIVDSAGDTATRTYTLNPGSATDPDVIATAVLTRLNAITDGVVKTYRLSHVFIEDALVLPAAPIEVEDQAKVVVGIQGKPLDKATVSIPAPIAALFVSTTGENRNVVNIANTDLVSYLNLWGSDQFLTISDGDFLDTPIKGWRAKKGGRG